MEWLADVWAWAWGSEWGFGEEELREGWTEEHRTERVEYGTEWRPGWTEVWAGREVWAERGKVWTAVWARAQARAEASTEVWTEVLERAQENVALVQWSMMGFRFPEYAGAGLSSVLRRCRRGRRKCRRKPRCRRRH